MASKRAKPVREVYLERGGNKTKADAESEVLAQLEKYIKNVQQDTHRGRRLSAGKRRRSTTIIGSAALG